MTTRDFRSQQIRTTQIIASGTSAGNASPGPSLLLYSASKATNDQGGYSAAMLTNVDNRAWLFISGSTNTDDGQNVSFGGNVGVSGSLTGSSFATFPGTSLELTSAQDITLNAADDVIIKSSGVEFIQAKNDTQDEVVINDGSADIDFRVESNTLQSAIHVNANQDLVILGRAGAPADLLPGTTPAVGTDVKVVIDGTAGSKDGATRGATLVAGDLVVSGTLYAEKQVMEVNLSQTGQLEMTGAIHFKNKGAAPGDAGQTGLAIGANDGAIFVATGSLFLRSTTDGVVFTENKVGATYQAGTGLSGTIAGSAETFAIRDNVVATVSGTTFTGHVAMTTGQKIYMNGQGGDVHFTGAADTLTIDGDDSITNIADNTFSVVAATAHADGMNAINITGAKTEFNIAKNKIDFMVHTDNLYQTLLVSGSDDSIILGYAGAGDETDRVVPGYGSDVKILLSGTVGSKVAGTRGVVQASGDMVISGTLYGATGTQYIKDANEGLKNTAGVAQLDLNSLTTSATIAVGDSIAFIDADGSSATKKGTIANLVTAIAGDGLTNSANQLQVGVDGSTIERSGDALRVKDAGITAAKIATAVAGDGLTGGGGSALAVNVGPGIKIGTGGNADKTMTDNTIVAHLTGSEFNGPVGVTGSFGVVGDVFVSEYIKHKGADVTRIRFQDDPGDGHIITFDVNNVEGLRIREDGADSQVVINEGSNSNLDFRVESDNDTKIIYVNSGLDYLSIGDDGDDGVAGKGVRSDNHFFVSGSIGGITSGNGSPSGQPGGVTLFGGDVVISGTLYNGNHQSLDMASFVENGSFSTAPQATSTNSIAIGNDAQATSGAGAFAIGNKTRATGARSIALGSATGNNTASGISAAALGGEAITASGDFSAVLGGQTNVASGNYSVAMGRTNTVAGEDSVAIGKSLTVPEDDTIALGNSSNNAKVVLSGTLKVNGATSLFGDVTVEEGADLLVSTYVKHRADTNTWISFNNDRIRLNTNGNNRVDINSSGQVLILSGGHSTSANPAAGTDVNFFVSGTIGSKGTATKGTSIFGGDVHISGALSGPSQYALTDNTVRVFRDGNTMKFIDGVTSAKTLEDLAQVTATNAFIVGVEGDSSTRSKLKTTASIAFAGDLDNYVTGLANPAGPTAVGSDVFFFVSGTLGAKDGSARHAALFGGDVVISGSSHLTDLTASFIKSSGEIVVGGNIIKNSNNDISMKFDSSNTNVLFGALQTGNPQTFVDIRKDDNTVIASATDGNDFSHYNIALRNHSTTENAFAGIAFDVADVEDPDTIGASIAALRDSTADTNNHDTNLIFMTNDAGDDGLTERLRITHDGKVGIGSDPSHALDVNGDIRIRGNDIRDNGGNPAITFDGSANTEIQGTLTLNSTIHGITGSLRTEKNSDVVFSAANGGINIDKSHAFHLDASTGKIGIHNANPLHKIHIVNDANAAGFGGGNNSIVMETVNASYAGAFLMRRAKGTIASPALTSNSTLLGEMIFEGYDGSDYEPAAAIKGEVSYTTAASNDMPGLLSFWTTSDGANSLTERALINHNGQFIVNPNGTWVGQNSEIFLTRQDWNAGSTPLPQAGFYNGASQRLEVIVDPTGDVGFKFTHASNDKLTISGSLEIEQDLALQNLTVLSNVIKASDGGNTITLDTSDNVTIGNDLTVGGNVIRASDGGATITMDTSDNVTIGGDLTINGNDLAFDTGASSIKVGASSGTNTAGNPLDIESGKSTGNASGGNINFGVSSPGSSGVGVNAPSIKMHVDRNGLNMSSELIMAGNNITSAGAMDVATTVGNLNLKATANNADITFTVDDNGADITALTLDGSDFGSAYFTPGNGGFVEVDDAGTDGKSKLYGEGILELIKYTDTANSSGKLTFSRTRGNSGGTSAVQSGDRIGEISFHGYDTSVLAEAASIRAVATANHGDGSDSSDSPGKLEFYTTPDGTSTSTLAMTIGSDQNVSVAGTLTALTYMPLERGVAIYSADVSGAGTERVFGDIGATGVDFTSGYQNKDSTGFAFVAPCDGHVAAASFIAEQALYSDSGSTDDIIYIKFYKSTAGEDWDDGSSAPYDAVGSTITVDEGNYVASWQGLFSRAGDVHAIKRTGSMSSWGNGGGSATYETSDGSNDMSSNWTFSKGDKLLFTIRYDAGDDSAAFYDEVANSHNNNATSITATFTLGLDWTTF